MRGERELFIHYARPDTPIAAAAANELFIMPKTQNQNQLPRFDGKKMYIFAVVWRQKIISQSTPTKQIHHQTSLLIYDTVN